MPARLESTRQKIHHPLDSAVKTGRHRKVGIAGYCDSHVCMMVVRYRRVQRLLFWPRSKPISHGVCMTGGFGTRHRPLMMACRVALIILAVVQVWSNPFGLHQPDAISYLNLSDAYAVGDYRAAISGYWSPLYPWLLGQAERLLAPSPYWESVVVHLMNVVIFCAALAAFEFFMRGLGGPAQWSAADDDTVVFNPGSRAGIVLAYSLFGWASLSMISVGFESPDMSAAALTLVAAGILLRLRGRETSSLMWLLFGITLGAAYFAKSAMFLAAFPFLLVAIAAVAVPRRQLARGVLASVAFAVTAAPLVTVISRRAHRLTFGESARLNYIWQVNRTTVPVGGANVSASDSEQTTTQETAQPPRLRALMTDPLVVGFRWDRPGSYPVLDDPAAWSSSARPAKLDVAQQLKTILRSVGFIASLFAPLALVLFILLYLSGSRQSRVASLLTYWYVALPPLAILAMYSLVWVEPRFIAGSWLILTFALLAGIRLPKGTMSKNAFRGAAYGLSLYAFCQIAMPLAIATVATARSIAGAGKPHVQWETAMDLRAMGLRPGEEVASLGYGGSAYWARLARLRIVAEVPEESVARYWTVEAADRARVAEALGAYGVKAMVANGIQPGAEAEGWTPVGGTGFYVLPLGRRALGVGPRR
jgi:hypothetical protein